MGTKTRAEIMELMQVTDNFNVVDELLSRIDFLKDYLKYSKANGFVLGVSGGVDSSVASRLAVLAIEELNEEEGTDKYKFVAVRLPYGAQKDEEAAQEALRVIQPTMTITVDIKPAVDATKAQLEVALGEEISDFNKGNIKARERMEVQYAIAGHYGLLVIGTDHSAENITGFYTKHGDGAADIAPLFGLNKRQVRALARELEFPEHLYNKVPTADLEDNNPGLPDETALGVTYNDIDNFLEGKEVTQKVEEALVKRFNATQHKRFGAVTIFDTWWK